MLTDTECKNAKCPEGRAFVRRSAFAPFVVCEGLLAQSRCNLVPGRATI